MHPGGKTPGVRGQSPRSVVRSTSRLLRSAAAPPSNIMTSAPSNNVPAGALPREVLRDLRRAGEPRSRVLRYVVEQLLVRSFLGLILPSTALLPTWSLALLLSARHPAPPARCAIRTWPPSYTERSRYRTTCDETASRDIGGRTIRLIPAPPLVRTCIHGGSDAEPRWIRPRRIPRSGQRGAHSSGRLSHLLRAVSARAGAASARNRENPR